MTEMKLPIIVTKEDCHRCHELKEWLDENNVKYIEQDIQDEEFVNQLLQDKNFIQTFCDADGCIVNTPVLIADGTYYFKELWGISGLRKEKAEELFLG
jgi:glutaredoxin